MYSRILAAALLALAAQTAAAVEGETYIVGAPAAPISKIEAMRKLIVSDNKAEVYKCVLVEVSTKGTLKNK